ncbi:MAG: MBL fold metallo-hydrolase [Anaerolineae bacterium]
MKATTYGNHLIQLTRYTAFNCFLVREDDGFTLVDTGLSGSAEAIIKAAQDHNGEIKRIVITHAHLDHLGSLDALRERLPNAEVMISARDARFMRGDKSLDADEAQMPLKGSYVETKTQPTRLLNNGDRIGSLEAIAAPGHTPGHMAYFDHRDRTLLAGDAYSIRGGLVTGGTLRPFFPFHSLATWNKPLSLRTGETLCALQPSRLAVGHGNTLENPVPAMEKAIAEARRKLGANGHVR